MDSFKFTSWNIEHSDKLIDDLSSTDARRRQRAERRRDAIKGEISGLGADILLISEGPNGEQRAAEFFGDVAPEYRSILRNSSERSEYGMRGSDRTNGRQWIWFLVRQGLPITASLLHLDRWREIAENNSNGAHSNGRWDISFPKFVDDSLGFEITRNHQHWRHPQVLQVEIDGAFFEIIGAHLKSKISRAPVVGDSSDEGFFKNNPALVADVVKSRVKISTEAADIRHYIDYRFNEDTSAALIVAGDLNDGPGKERIERRFLYHDLVSSLQGEVFFAQRLLNHALFDFEEDQRWTVFFRDRLDAQRNPRILLDHILFSQSFTDNPQVNGFAYRARRRGGLVEHAVHHAVTGAFPRYAMTSDHKPVSMTFERRQGS